MRYSFLSHFGRILDSRLPKCEKNLLKKMQRGIKNVEFYAEFKSLEKGYENHAKKVVKNGIFIYFMVSGFQLFRVLELS